MPSCLPAHPVGSSAAAVHISYCILFLSTVLLMLYLSSAYGMISVHRTGQEGAAGRHRSEEMVVKGLIPQAVPLHREPRSGSKAWLKSGQWCKCAKKTCLRNLGLHVCDAISVASSETENMAMAGVGQITAQLGSGSRTREVSGFL